MHLAKKFRRDNFFIEFTFQQLFQNPLQHHVFSDFIIMQTEKNKSCLLKSLLIFRLNFLLIFSTYELLLRFIQREYSFLHYNLEQKVFKDTFQFKLLQVARWVFE